MMRLREFSVIALITVLLLSCGVRGSRSIVSTDHLALVEGYAQEQSVPFLYTEAIRCGLVGTDSAQIEKLLLRALELDSLHGPSWYELAMLHLEEPRIAIPYCRKASSLEMSNIWYRELLGQLMIINQQYDSALVVYRSLVKDSPNNPELFYRQAALLNMEGHPYEAIFMLDSAERRFGTLEALSGLKRQLLIQAKLYDKALDEAKTIVDNYPYDENNWLALAELYAQTGKDSLAQDAFDKALTINPKSVPTLASMNDYYKRIGDSKHFFSTAKALMSLDALSLETKIEFYDEITRSQEFYRDNFFKISDLLSSLAIKYPANYEVTKLLTRHLIAAGSLEEALQVYKANLVQKVPNRDAFNEVLNIEAYLNRPDSVSKYSAMAMTYFPSDVDFHLRKGGVTSYYMKDYTGAQIEYRKALKLAEGDSLRSSIYLMLGDNCYQMGDLSGCFKYYKKALRLDTANVVAYNNFAYYLSEQEKQLDLAEKMSLKANQLAPSNPTYIDTQAWVYYKQGRYEEAKALMQLALALDATASNELMVHYGDILYALKDHFMAAFYWKKALDKGYDPDKIEERLRKIETPRQ